LSAPAAAPSGASPLPGSGMVASGWLVGGKASDRMLFRPSAALTGAPVYGDDPPTVNRRRQSGRGLAPPPARPRHRAHQNRAPRPRDVDRPERDRHAPDPRIPACGRRLAPRPCWPSRSAPPLSPSPPCGIAGRLPRGRVRPLQ
jgi:hypothetical protein